MFASRRLMLALAGAGAMFLSGLGVPVAEAGLRVSFVFQQHQQSLTSRQARRLRYYHRRGCRVFSLTRRQQRFALRSLSHAFTAMNDKQFLKIIQTKRFTYTQLSGAAILRKIQMKHRSLPVFGYNSQTNCPVGHSATAFAIHGMIFLRATYLDRVIRTNNWRRLAQTLAHEWMHGVGFGHGRNDGQSSTHKRNSVPIYIGCLTKYYPRLTHAQRVCARGKTKRSPYLAHKYRALRGQRSQRYHRIPRYRQPTHPFLPRYHARGGGDWLNGRSQPSRRTRRQPSPDRSPFYAPLPPKDPPGDWLDGD